MRAPSREPASHSQISLFPLGMFEFESAPQFDKYTFLWLIDWTSYR